MEGKNLLKNPNQVIIPQNEQSALSTVLESNGPESMISDISSLKKTEPDFTDWLYEQGFLKSKAHKQNCQVQMSLSESHLNKYFPDISVIHKVEQSFIDQLELSKSCFR